MQSRAQAIINAAVHERKTKNAIISVVTPPQGPITAANPSSINIPWVTTAGSVAANVRNYMVIALKPGTANLGAIATPAGWTLVDSHIGGGYGSTLGVDTGNTRVAMFIKDGDNTSSGTVAVTLTPDGANAVASGVMGRIEKTSGSWKPIVTNKSEATVDTNAGSYAIASPMAVSRGDVLVYGFAFGYFILGGTGLSSGTGLTALNPALATDNTNNNGFHEAHVSTGRRATQGLTGGLPTPQVLTAPPGNIMRGPLIIARMRVR
jgi:hypothetical protein